MKISILTARLSQVQRDIDITKWRFASAQSNLQRGTAATKLISLELKAHLLASFSRSSRPDNISVSDPELLRLKSIEATAASTTAQLIVKRLLAIKSCMNDWEKAKKYNDFSLVQDSLQILIDIKKQEASKRAEILGLASPYEAILDLQTPGLRKDNFEKWDKDLSSYCKTALDDFRLQKKPKISSYFSMSAQKQKILAESIFTQMGVDLGHLKISETAHPICLGSHDNVAIGMRYNEANYAWLLQAISHEGGHALYRQNLPREHKDKLCGQVAGTGIDEAMALILENHVCRSKDYAFHMSRFIKNRFGEPYKSNLSHHDLHAQMVKVSDIPIRTEADEIRYPLDVILRYRLERALFDEGLSVKDLPERWRREFKSLTGMDVKTDNEGVLQDIHWFGGEFGWFPNYLFGQLAAAQLFNTACKEYPDIVPAITKGDIRPLKEWLDQNIYQKGAFYSPLDLIDVASGGPLGTASYKEHIETSYNLGKGLSPKPPSLQP